MRCWGRSCPRKIKDLNKRFKYCWGTQFIYNQILLDLYVFICPGKAEQQTLYEDYLKHNGNWKKGLIWREIVRRHRGASRGVRRWLTRDQLIVHFGNNAKVADAVIQRKKDTPDLKNEVRGHPDHPDLPGPCNSTMCLWVPCWDIKLNIIHIIIIITPYAGYIINIYIYMFSQIGPAHPAARFGAVPHPHRRRGNRWRWRPDDGHVSVPGVGWSGWQQHWRGFW